MSDSEHERDRYVTFEGLDCDGHARQFLARLKEHIEAGHGEAPWRAYLSQKLEERARLQTDELFFVGSQMNALYSYLEGCGDEALSSLLWQLEQECC